MSIIQNILSHFPVLVVALAQCGSAFFTLLGSVAVAWGVYMISTSKNNKQGAGVGPAILIMVGGPLAVASGVVLLVVNIFLANVVPMLPAKDMFQLGGHAALLGFALIAIGVGLEKALARAFEKNENVVFFPVAAFLVGGLMLLSGMSTTALGLLA